MDPLSPASATLLPKDSSESAPGDLPSPEEPIRLQVGDRFFTVMLSTLTDESAWFATKFGGDWLTVSQADGSYYIEADGDLFAHILRYLRFGVFPLFWTQSGGHDYALYLALQAQADYFNLTKLVKYLNDKQYLSAVKVEYRSHVVSEAENIFESRNADDPLEYHIRVVKEEYYVCPRRIAVHTEPERCGRVCANAQGDREDEYKERDRFSSIAISKRLIIDNDLLMGRK